MSTTQGEPYGHIYCFTCTVTEKQYIGQSTNLESRLADHRGARNKSSLLHKAIRKYGLDAFVVDVLCTCTSQEELDEREIHYVQALNTLAPHGYNLRAGRGRGVMSEITRRRLSEAGTGLKRARDSVERTRIGQRRFLDSPESRAARERMSAAARRYAQTPEGQAQRRKQFSGPEAGQAQSARLRQQWESEDYRQHRSAALSAYYNSPEGQQKLQEISAQRTPESRQRQAESNRRYYQEHPEARIAQSERMKAIAAEKRRKRNSKI